MCMCLCMHLMTCVYTSHRIVSHSNSYSRSHSHYQSHYLTTSLSLAFSRSQACMVTCTCCDVPLSRGFSASRSCPHHLSCPPLPLLPLPPPLLQVKIFLSCYSVTSCNHLSLVNVVHTVNPPTCTPWLHFIRDAYNRTLITLNYVHVGPVVPDDIPVSAVDFHCTSIVCSHV